MPGGKRRTGVVVMAAGLVFAVLGKALSVWELALLATVLLIGGGVLVAMSFRDELGYTPSVSRASMLGRAAAGEMRRSRRRSPAPARVDARADDHELVTYVAQVHDVLLDCTALLARPPSEVGAEELDETRERLMLLVASRRYGAALEREMIDESTVQGVSHRLAAHPSAPAAD